MIWIVFYIRWSCKLWVKLAFSVGRFMFAKILHVYAVGLSGSLGDACYWIRSY